MTTPTPVIDLFGPRPEPEQRPGSDTAHMTTGRVAEFLVCASIAQMGYRVVHCPSSGYDLLADIGGQIVRVQVKGVSRPTGSRYASHGVVELPGPSTGYKQRSRICRPINAGDCDVVAVTAMDLRRVMYLPITDVSERGSISVPVQDFRHPDGERLSWLRAVEEACDATA